MMTTDERLASGEALSAQPLYQLSTAGMELFHTNVVYWLAKNRFQEAAPLWERLGMTGLSPVRGGPFVEREWRHFDFVLGSGPGGDSLVIENKIGAIPQVDQLQRYAASLAEKPGPLAGGSIHHTLLTLTPPLIALPSPWTSVLYRDLIPALEATARNLSGDDRRFVEQYVALVKGLDSLAQHYDPRLQLDESVELPAVERDALHEMRLLSLVEKVRASQFAAHCVALMQESFPALAHDATLANTVRAEFSRSTGLVEWWFRGPKDRSFGWQIQGDQFRLAIVTSPRDPQVRAKREQLVEANYADFFDFDLHRDEVNHVLLPYEGKKEWLGYEPNFVYRYARISPRTTWEELAIVAAMFAERTVRYVENLT